MRRRHSRLALLAIGCAAVLLGASVAMAASGMGPSADFLAWIGGQASGTSVPSVTSDGAPPTIVAAAAGGSASVAPLATATDQPATLSSAAAVPSHVPSTSGSTPSVPRPATPEPARSATPRPAASATPTPGTSAVPAVTISSTRAVPVSNGSRSKKVIALTFDDGYSPTALREIVAILKREHVTATFFPYGWAVSNDPAGWHMVAAAGYPIGNHTLRHTILTSIPPDRVYEEMTRGRRTIDLYSGARSVNLMRPPGGAFNAAVAREIKRAGYDVIVLWDVDTFDWQGPSPDTIYARAIRGTNGSIVLMHSGPPNTPKALPRIIANYRARGFTFVTVPQLLGVG